jgi:hypothetical protein
VTTIKWALWTTAALLGVAVVLRLLLLLLSPLLPWLIVLVFMLMVFGILVRGR